MSLAKPGSGALDDDLARLPARSSFVAGVVRQHVLSYDGDGPPLLVLPGITSPAISWDFVARALADLAAVHVVDLRGRGLSDRPNHGYALDDYAADVAKVVRGLRLESPILLGHSLGARIAAKLAVTQPQLPGALILVDPPLSGPGKAPYPTGLDAFQQQLREAARGTTAEQVRRFYPHWPQAELELRARWLATCSEQAVVETHRGFEEEGFEPLWRALRPPAALLYGAESPVVTAAGALELQAANPAVPLVEIPGAGHMVPWDSFDPFVAAVRRLLSHFAGHPTEKETP